MEPNINVIQNIIQEHAKKVSEELNDKLEIFLSEKLKVKGFEFESHQDFLDFVKNRITLVLQNGLNIIHLDWKNENEPGVKLIGYKYKMNLETSMRNQYKTTIQFFNYE